MSHYQQPSAANSTSDLESRRPSAVSFTDLPPPISSHKDAHLISGLSRALSDKTKSTGITLRRNSVENRSPSRTNDKLELRENESKLAGRSSSHVQLQSPSLQAQTLPTQPPQPTQVSQALQPIVPPQAPPPPQQQKYQQHQQHTMGQAAGGTGTGSEDDGKIHILLAVTGSVATIKIAHIIGKLKEIYREQAEIQLIVTASAEHFMAGLKIPAEVKVWHDNDEWDSRRGVAETMLHVRLRRWADVLLIAPLSANTLAKIANGICNNLITSVIRSWNPAVPILIAPAMNTHMYTNPMTKKHLQMIKEEFYWIETLKPVEKVLVCGDIGMGGMREWSDIVDILVTRLGGRPDEDEDEEEEEEEEEKEEE